jgi:DNA (cytosine-5)-methyltransferase 1
MYSGFDLFAGAGGLSEGFIQAGFDIIGSIEKEKWACESQKTRHIYHHLKKENDLDDYWNYCRETLSTDDIYKNREKIYKKINGLKEKVELTVWNAAFGNPASDSNTFSSKKIIELLEKSANFHRKKVDFIIGGPPCQAYSLVGRNRMGRQARNDKRNYLFKYYFNVVKHFQPDFFLFENVPGILSAHNGNILKIIQEDFSKIGYDLKTGIQSDIKKNVHNASDYGVPQNRKRFIFLGVRSSVALNYPEFCFEKNIEQLTTLNTIGDLPFLNAGDGNDQGVIPYPENIGLSEYQMRMRQNSFGVMNHKARPINKWYDKEIYRVAIKKSQRDEALSYSELPSRLKTHENEHNFPDRFRVHPWNKLPHTIVAHISKDGHYNIHPDLKQLRALTVREAARIQSFPDDFKFEGPRTSQYEQVGNAVPPLMAEIIARKLRKYSGESKK